MDLFLSLGIALLAGLFLSRLAKVLSLPAVTAYLVAGVILGPYILGQLAKVSAFSWVSHLFLTDPEKLGSLHIITEVALGFIAFSIGSEFRWSSLKQTGKQAAVVGTVQAVVTTAVVDVVLIILHFLFPQVISLGSALVLGAVASATAPATTLMVVQQYKAKGPLTSILLPIVALDDAVGLVLFSVSFGVAKALEEGVIDLVSVIVNPIIEIVCSLLLGLIMGLLFTWSEKFFHSRSKRLSISVAFVFLTVGCSTITIPLGRVEIAFSSLLSCMMLGLVFCNICDFSEELMDRLSRWTGPLYVLFFVCSGAALNLTVFGNLGVVICGLAYVIFRMVGKYIGNYFSAKAMKCEPAIQKNLGIAMFPQAGVALGMATVAATGLHENGEFIQMIILFGVLIYELFSPMLSKMALMRAGDIQPEERKSSRGHIG